MAHIIVRPGILSDAESFAAMKFKTWNECYYPFGVRGDGLMVEDEVPPFITGWPARIANPQTTTIVAYDPTISSVVGYCTATAQPNKAGYIDIRAVYVLSTHYRLGIATRMLDLATNGRSTRAMVATLRVNTRAQTFYRNLGFTRVIIEQDQIMGGAQVGDIQLARDVGGPETPFEEIHEKA